MHTWLLNILNRLSKMFCLAKGSIIHGGAVGLYEIVASIVTFSGDATEKREGEAEGVERG